MSNETFWALKRREQAARQKPTRRSRRNIPVRVGTPKPIPAATLEATAADIVEATDSEAEEPSYRDLQAQAKDLGIKANKPADELKAEIEKAG